MDRTDRNTQQVQPSLVKFSRNRIGLKWTETNRNGQKLAETKQYRHKRTENNKNEQKWTETDRI